MPIPTKPKDPTRGDPLTRALRAWHLETTTPPPSSPSTLDAQLKTLRVPYTIYGPMLLLPARAIDLWTQHLVTLHPTDDTPPRDLTPLYAHLNAHLRTTHIATTYPIPLHTDSGMPGPNTLRSPLSFTPLSGAFGPATSSDPPTRADFATAFWTSARQNGVLQVWAPRWTMFSRGNVSEKARVLGLGSVAAAVAEGRGGVEGGGEGGEGGEGLGMGQGRGRGCAAVDLYVGIGYFAFSYLKAGVDVVLGWDVNGWSCEGLRKGAAANKWASATYAPCEDVRDVLEGGPRLVVFEESNEFAAERIRGLREWIPPVRHVNCGLLPTSRGSWETAFEVLDRQIGGWVHVHENAAVDKTSEKAEEVRSEFQRMMKMDSRSGNAEVEDVHQVKTYAPGVMHIVVDIAIPPPPST